MSVPMAQPQQTGAKQRHKPPHFISRVPSDTNILFTESRLLPELPQTQIPPAHHACARAHTDTQTHTACVKQVAAGAWACRRDCPWCLCSVEDSVSAEQVSFPLSKPIAMSLKISVSPDSRFNLVKGSFQVSVKKINIPLLLLTYHL